MSEAIKDKPQAERQPRYIEAGKIDRLIINSPFDEPTQYWHYDPYKVSGELFERIPGRRPSGYTVATPNSRDFDDPGITISLTLVNTIRERVKQWREDNYPGITGITKRLLKHWHDPDESEEERQFFFCQIEAIETLIFLLEAPEAMRADITIPSDGGDFKRLCSKLATGTGKTVVMAMLIAWHVLNKVTYPDDVRFSKNIFVVAPGLTVKNRLAVLQPTHAQNFYHYFRIVPNDLNEGLLNGKIIIENWHSMQWESEEQVKKKRSVDKRGALSDEAYVRAVLGDMASARDILVINDEAHHAWRVPPDTKAKDFSKEDLEEATKWIGGLDRIHKTRNILSCHDFTATPFVPGGKKSTNESVFEWVVSDFGLNDAIESGLVKTPRIVVRDDGPLTNKYKPKLYHIYNDKEVKTDLARGAEEHEDLPTLVTNAYELLVADWSATKKDWEKAGVTVPPVMITVANRTETAARVKYAFDKKRIHAEELSDPDKTLRIDSKILSEAEARQEPVTVELPQDDEAEGEERKLSKKKQAELLRRQVDTVGQLGQLGEQIQNVISVGMLSEGWDAKTVTHIMGLRAFTSQLLCEQVVGRGLRRMSYELNDKGMFDPEYVNIFGVPFSFLPQETSAEGSTTKTATAKREVRPLADRTQFEISYPNIIRINHRYAPKLEFDLEKIDTLVLEAFGTITHAYMAAVIGGKPNLQQIMSIDLENFAQKYRLQTIIFSAVARLVPAIKQNYQGSESALLPQLMYLTEKFINSDKIQINPPLFNDDEARKRIIISLHMDKVVQHLANSLNKSNPEDALEIVFDKAQPIRTTGDMFPWATSKPCWPTRKSHINLCVFDSTWEASESSFLDQPKYDHLVQAWVKNDHLGFEILYAFGGTTHKYRPDFLVRLSNASMLILETKGQDSPKEKTKRDYMKDWVRAVNSHGGFGTWHYEVSFNPADVVGTLNRLVKV
jgi:type III restriction enzyme